MFIYSTLASITCWDWEESILPIQVCKNFTWRIGGETAVVIMLLNKNCCFFFKVKES